MSQLVKISHPQNLPVKSWKAPGKIKHRDEKIISWDFESDDPTVISCAISFESPVAFNYFAVDLQKDRTDLFPEVYRLEISQDGVSWEPLLREKGNHALETGGLRWHFALTTASYVKLVAYADRPTQKGYGASFGEFRLGVSGVVHLEASGELDRLWVKENLFDQRLDYGWSTPIQAARKEEYVFMDLGSMNRVGELRLLSKDDPEPFFPASFRLVFSEDNISWHHLMDENGYLAEPGTWYRWRFVPQNMRYIKLIVDEGAKTREGKYVSQIIELELYAVSDGLEEKSGQGSGNPVHLPYASVLRSGIVRLSMDGESREGVAVQSSDRRLKDATTEAKGIVELATDGEENSGVAVQGNDRRLRYATEDLPGIVRLARDGEQRAHHVVQGSDARLKDATTEAKGIVELATDGEDREGVVVQGNDSRLKLAKEGIAGIVKLAPDGSQNPGLAVQGNDRRLREATTEIAGVLRFASHKESAKLAAVQGDDPRLKAATTEAKGIVELATDGEDREGVVVQGSDSRLKPATVDGPGIIALNPPGGAMEGRAIQGNDPRLTDDRTPKPHTHDYAPLDHSFSSHSGNIHLDQSSGKAMSGIGAVPVGHSPIQGINQGEGSGLSGHGRLDGVIGSGGRTGVRGYSTGDGPGVVGASRKGPGGEFYSEQSYSLIAGGERADQKLRGSALGLRVYGLTRMSDPLLLGSESETDGNSVLAMYFSVERDDVIVPGDLLVVSNEPGFVRKAREKGQTSIIGVAVDHASVILDAPGSLDERGNQAYTGLMKQNGKVLVAIGGVVKVRATAKGGEIHPGDLVIGSAEFGCVEKGQPSGMSPGSLVGRSLDRLLSGEGMVRVVLATT